MMRNGRSDRGRQGRREGETGRTYLHEAISQTDELGVGVQVLFYWGKRIKKYVHR